MTRFVKFKHVFKLVEFYRHHSSFIRPVWQIGLAQQTAYVRAGFGAELLSEAGRDCGEWAHDVTLTVTPAADNAAPHLHTATTCVPQPEEVP